ncbi:MAG: ABC transporter permease, partial [Actinomycetota bacterium]
LGDPALPTIEVEIYQRAIQRLDLAGAATLALLQLLVVVVAVAISSRQQERLAVSQRLQHGESRQPVRGAGAIACTAFAYVLAFLLVVPLVSLVSRSLRVGDGWGLQWYSLVAQPADDTSRSVPLLQSIELSLRYAVVATLVAVGLGLLACIGIQASRRRGVWVDALVTLPLGVSAVTVGLGLLLGSLRGPVDLRGWWLLVPLGQALVALPIVVRVVLPILRSFDPRMRDVAATLGASPVRAWMATEGAATVKAIVLAAALACAVSLGEFGATAFLVRLDTPTIPVQVVRLLGRPGEANIGQAAALSVILVAITLAVVAAGERLRPRRGGGW